MKIPKNAIKVLVWVFFWWVSLLQKYQYTQLSSTETKDCSSVLISPFSIEWENWRSIFYFQHQARLWPTIQATANLSI